MAIRNLAGVGVFGLVAVPIPLTPHTCNRRCDHGPSMTEEGDGSRRVRIGERIATGTARLVQSIDPSSGQHLELNGSMQLLQSPRGPSRR